MKERYVPDRENRISFNKSLEENATMCIVIEEMKIKLEVAKIHPGQACSETWKVKRENREWRRKIKQRPGSSHS